MQIEFHQIQDIFPGSLEHKPICPISYISSNSNTMTSDDIKYILPFYCLFNQLLINQRLLLRKI